MRTTAMALAALMMTALTASAFDNADAIMPTALGQFQSDGTTPIGQNGVAALPTVVFSGVVHNTSGVPIRLQIELRLNSTPFSNVATHTAVPWTTNNNVSTLTVSGLTPGASYHWQARTQSN